MIKVVFKIFSFFFLLILISSSSHAVPRLTAEQPVFNFGSIREGKNVPVTFEITNTGTGVAQITEIRTFAACVVSAPLQKNTLKPGESMKLDYEFESLGYGGVAVDKRIEVYYNNSKQSPLKLFVKGDVLPLEAYQAAPGELRYNFFVLIDVRSPAQFRREHIIGAINVPAEKIVQWAASVSKSISDEVVIYLYSEDGIKSDKAAGLLRGKGYSQYSSIVGGLKEWKYQNAEKYLVSGRY